MCYEHERRVLHIGPTYSPELALGILHDMKDFRTSWRPYDNFVSPYWPEDDRSKYCGILGKVDFDNNNLEFDKRNQKRRLSFTLPFPRPITLDDFHHYKPELFRRLTSKALCHPHIGTRHMK